MAAACSILLSVAALRHDAPLIVLTVELLFLIFLSLPHLLHLAHPVFLTVKGLLEVISLISVDLAARDSATDIYINNVMTTRRRAHHVSIAAFYILYAVLFHVIFQLCIGLLVVIVLRGRLEPSAILH